MLELSLDLDQKMIPAFKNQNHYLSNKLSSIQKIMKVVERGGENNKKCIPSFQNKVAGGTSI